MIVTSFFPGRIRLRAPVFRDTEIFERAKSIIQSSTDAVKTIERNPVNGSVLITYSPEKIPVEKLAGLKTFFERLQHKAEHYTPEDKGPLMEMLNEFEQITRTWG